MVEGGGELTGVSPTAQLKKKGVVLLRAVLDAALLKPLKEAASACFRSIDSGASVPGSWQFRSTSNSVLLTALLDSCCTSTEELLAPLSTPSLKMLIDDAMESLWMCQLEQSWVRKKTASAGRPGIGYHLQDWHQDGALGVSFPPQPGPLIPMTDLMTVWIPLDACGVDSPGLEFIHQRQPALLHFTELGDSALRQRFSAERFWAPVLELGDCLIFLKDVLHRTRVHPAMKHDRLSVEYRIFPQPPQRSQH